MLTDFSLQRERRRQIQSGINETDESTEGAAGIDGESIGSPEESEFIQM